MGTKDARVSIQMSFPDSQQLQPCSASLYSLLRWPPSSRRHRLPRRTRTSSRSAQSPSRICAWTSSLHPARASDTLWCKSHRDAQLTVRKPCRKERGRAVASQTFEWETQAPDADPLDFTAELLRSSYQVNGAPGCLWTEARESPLPTVSLMLQRRIPLTLALCRRSRRARRRTARSTTTSAGARRTTKACRSTDPVVSALGSR